MAEQNVTQQYNTILVEKEDQITTIYLNRPPYNPLSSELFAELSDAMDKVAQDEETRVLIITGKGDKALAAGADIKEMARLDDSEIINMNKISRQAFSKIANLDKPTIAAINGLALGGGLELALTCDFRICSENAKLGLPEINLAIIPGGGGTQRLQRLVGQAKAKELLFLGETIKAEDALAMGLVNQVVPLEELLNAAKELAKKLAEKPPLAMRMLKMAVNSGAHLDLEAALDLEFACFTTTFASEDRKEGMQAFIEKRKPQFKGR